MIPDSKQWDKYFVKLKTRKSKFPPGFSGFLSGSQFCNTQTKKECPIKTYIKWIWFSDTGRWKILRVPVVKGGQILVGIGSTDLLGGDDRSLLSWFLQACNHHYSPDFQAWAELTHVSRDNYFFFVSKYHMNSARLFFFKKLCIHLLIINLKFPWTLWCL